MSMDTEFHLHVPRTRNGGSFTDSKDVNLHANDFDWNTRISELTSEQRAIVTQYKELCLTELQRSDSVVSQVDVSPKPWEAHFCASKHHFPLKNYIVHAFPLLRNVMQREEDSTWILECGCGTGSTLLPIMRECASPTTHFVGFDISEAALSHFGDHEIARDFLNRKQLTLFPLAAGAAASSHTVEANMAGHKRQRVDDSDDLIVNALAKSDESLQGQTFDAVLLVFVLSALPSVKKMIVALRQLKRVLKPSGTLYFRDYGLGDHNFFRFLAKNGNKLNGTVFVKGDATTQMFFHKEFVLKLFASVGFTEVDHPASQLTYHCNHIVNRKNGKQMDKIFVNGAFKITSTGPSA